jgi:hypothetical protein
LLGHAIAVSLPIERPVIPDARMSPHEVVRARDGQLFKTDATSDGDDHLLPGPTDIAWDLAGVIHEWDLSTSAAATLLDRYRRRSGDDARARLPGYLVAYGLFRAAFWKMAADSSRGDDEHPRLVAAFARARTRLERWLSHRPPGSPRQPRS